MISFTSREFCENRHTEHRSLLTVVNDFVSFVLPIGTMLDIEDIHEMLLSVSEVRGNRSIEGLLTSINGFISTFCTSTDRCG